MYLLQLEENGDFSLVGYVSNDLPRYAILSHTWGSDEEEVTFQDIKNGTGRGKRGFRKIRFCAKQAANDGLQHFWVDSCCINKESSAELQEAINSMFRWYQSAEKCYVYLSDVSNRASNNDGDASKGWEIEFEKSRWFTRGWTLQELIAPASVEFFSEEEVRLGDKQSLEQSLHRITGVAVKALQGSPLSEFTESERFSWAAKRQTKREEDEAYCMLGIFGVYLPLIYGEGRQNAKKRLQREVKGTTRTSSDGLAYDTQSESRSEMQDVKASKIRQWLSAPDQSLNYQKALKQRQEGTGRWLLESDQYDSWKADAASFLWLHGIPGCGKTILTSTILEDVLQQSDDGKVVVYFFFDFNDVQKQNPELMLRSLTCQLLQQSVNIPASLDTLFSSCDSGQRQPSLHAILEVMQQMMQEFSDIYIVLDALDECSKRAELLEILEMIAAWHVQNLHVLLTSRRERDIENSLDTFVDSQNIVCLQSALVDRDIQKYIRQRLYNDRNLTKWRNDAIVRQEIETALTKGAHGMFRWAVCQLDLLGQCRTRAMLRRALATLPSTLDGTYERILSTIREADSQYAIPILQWLTFAARPLSLDEVAEIVAIDVKDEPKFDREEVLEDPTDVLSICSSLITVTTDKAARKVVLLAHYSVKEYLVSDRIRKGPAARYGMQDATFHHDSIAKGCIAYLLQFQELEVLDQDTIKTFKLAEYAAKFWVEHARGAKERTEGFSQAAMDLLSENNAPYLNWLRIHNPDVPWVSDFRRTLASVAAPLYYACLSGLGNLVKLLLTKGANVNPKGGYYDSALQVASARGQEQVVRLLIDKGANVNTQGGRSGNALQAASYHGHEQLVDLLLRMGANIDAQGGLYSNALQAALAQGYEQVARLLLDKGADVNAQGGLYGNALQAAIGYGYEQFVGQLLDKGADVNAQGGYYGNALQAASLTGHAQVARLLLERGADVNVKGGYYGNALQAALAGGHEQVVTLLLDKGADINAQGGMYGNALQTAAARGYVQLVQLLLERGANWDGHSIMRI